MKIKNIDGLSASDLQGAVKNGGRFVYYAWTISLILFTFKRTSGVYLVKANENRITKGLIFTFVTFLFGWWSIPAGPRHTINSIRTNFGGGKDVTEEIMSVVAGYVLFEENQRK